MNSSFIHVTTLVDSAICFSLYEFNTPTTPSCIARKVPTTNSHVRYRLGRLLATIFRQNNETTQRYFSQDSAEVHYQVLLMIYVVYFVWTVDNKGLHLAAMTALPGVRPDTLADFIRINRFEVWTGDIQDFPVHVVPGTVLCTSYAVSMGVLCTCTSYAVCMVLVPGIPVREPFWLLSCTVVLWYCLLSWYSSHYSLQTIRALGWLNNWR